MEADILKDVPADDIPLLLADLQADMPNSIHAHAFISTLLKWKENDPQFEMQILAPEGDFKRKIAVFYFLFSDAKCWFGSIHKWSNDEDTNKLLHQVLENTKHIPRDRRLCVITCSTPDTLKVVMPYFRGIGNGHEFTDGLVFRVRKEEAVKWTSEAPEGTYLAHLKEDNCYEINEIWPHRFDGSEELVRLAIKMNFGIGLYDSKTHELMSWALFWFYGGVGVLQTKEAHKRKQYGTAVLKAITKEIGEKGYDVHLNVVDGNTPSATLMEKLGYEFLFMTTWVSMTPSSK